MGDGQRVERRASPDDAPLDRIYGELQSIHGAVSTLVQQMAVAQTKQTHQESAIEKANASIERYKADRGIVVGVLATFTLIQGLAAYVVTSWLDNVNQRFNQFTSAHVEMRADIRKLQDAQLSAHEARPR